jgi:hypothetical protein
MQASSRFSVIRFSTKTFGTIPKKNHKSQITNNKYLNKINVLSGVPHVDTAGISVVPYEPVSPNVRL